MSTSNQVMASPAQAAGRSEEGAGRFGSWLVLIIGALSVGLLGSVVGNYAKGTDATVMAMLATAGYLFGFALARAGVPDILAHLLSFFMGIAIALVAISPHQLYIDLQARQWQTILDRYGSLLSGFIDSIDAGDRFETDVAVFAIGLTMWMVGYTAAWMLFRRNWIFWAVVLPGAILLFTLAIDRDQPTWPALLYLALALALAASQTSVVRSTSWSARGIEQPRTFGRRSVLLGCAIAALAVAAAVNSTFDLDDSLKERAVDSGDQLASWVSERLDPSNSNGPKPLSTQGNYGSFADQFKVGDGVPSGDSPVAIVQSNGEEYLAARRMNQYDGTGWRASASETSQGFSAQAPRISFQADQTINPPRAELQYRAPDDASITLLQAADNLLFTIDQHYSASVPTLVRVGWEDVDETYTIGDVDVAEVPVDLRELIILLQSASFTDPAVSDAPELVSPQAKAELDRIQTRLGEDYPVEIELQWSDSGDVQVKAEGRVPVYADVEAVYSNDDLDGQTYSVVGMRPAATADQLRSAGTDYPEYITDTYLDLPDTVTDRTRALAAEIVRTTNATTPYDQAVAIQNYLRGNYTYRIDAGADPDGGDIVDYFLFESKVGRCDHYSSSMAVMLRSLGVPTRIVVGFAPVSYDPEMSGYVYRGRNAHAWVEVYIPDYGWIPFEPTPTQSPIGIDSAIDTAAPTPEPTPNAEPTEAPTDTEPQPTATATATPVVVPSITDTDGSASDSHVPPWKELAAGAALLTLAAAAAGIFWRRRHRFAGMPVAGANYSRLQRLGRFVGVEASPELTPQEYATRFGAARPASAAGALRVADAFTQERYATNVDAGTIAQQSELGWREAKKGASDWRFWRRP